MPKKKKTGKATEQNTMIVGLDIGYGITKAVTNDSTELFPSVAGRARQIKFKADEISERYPGDQLTDEYGEHWFIGDLALSQLRAGEVFRLRGRTADESQMGNVFRKRMMLAALGKLFPGKSNGDVVHIILATGLPVDHMPDANDLKMALCGVHPIRTDQTDFVAHITDVMVMPQPYGTIYNQMLNDDGTINECYTYSRTGVLDVGTYTIDATLDDDGEYIDSLSGSVEAGVYTAHEYISGAIERDYRQKPTHRAIESVLRTGCMDVHGKKQNYGDVVRDAKKTVQTAATQLASEKWQNGLDVDVIFVSGGGAEMVFHDVKSHYPQTQIADNAPIANAQGYAKYARFAAQDTE